MCLDYLKFLIFYNSSFAWHLLYFQLCSVFLIEQIIHLFIIDLNIRAMKKLSFLFLWWCSCYYLFECSGYYSFLLLWVSSCHCICFTTASLSICKDCSIITLKNILNKHECTLFINLLLRRLRSKYMIKSENFLILSWAFWLWNCYLMKIIVYQQNVRFWVLLSDKWSTSYHNFNILRHKFTFILL